MKRFLLKAGIWLNIAVTIPLLLAYVAPFVSPASAWLFAFFGLLYPVWLGMNVFFLLLWAILRHRFVFLPLLSIVAGWHMLQHFFGWQWTTSPPASAGITAMTYNVRNFDLYDWNHNAQGRAEILDLIDKQQPDILCLQEYYSQPEGEFENDRSIRQQLKLPFRHIKRQVTVKNGGFFGVATFSRFPIVRESAITFPNTYNLCLVSDLKIGEDTVRVFNVHLQSTYLGVEAEAYVQQLVQEQSTDRESSKRIFSKLLQGFQRRALQADSIAGHIAASPYPVMVCGDFNDTPASYTYRQMSQGLQDAFLATGLGVGATFAGNIPWLRIDYIFLDPRMEVLSYHTPRMPITDHFPVITRWRME